MNDTPTPEAIAAAKELHSEQWHGMTYEQMITVGALAIDRHFAQLRQDKARLETTLCFCDGVFEVIEVGGAFNMDGVKEARRRISAAIDAAIAQQTASKTE
jgi:hypothetical protein